MTATLTPLAAAFTRVAALINDEDLPEASVTINLQHVTIGATYSQLPENAVRRWAQALDLIVTESPFDWEGAAATLYTASGSREGVFYSVSAIVPIEPVTSETARAMALAGTGR